MDIHDYIINHAIKEQVAELPEVYTNKEYKQYKKNRKWAKNFRNEISQKMKGVVANDN